MSKKKYNETYNASIIGDGAIAQGSGARAVGSKGVMVIGDGNIVIGGEINSASEVYELLVKRISDLDISQDSKGDLQAEIRELLYFVRSDDQIDEKSVYRKLRNIGRISPDILDIVISTLSKPITNINLITRKVIESYRQNSA